MAQKVDFTKKLTDLDGVPLINKTVSVERFITCEHCGEKLDLSTYGTFEEQSVTLRAVAVDALLSQHGELKGNEAYERYRFARRIHDRDVIELTAEEVTLLKELIKAQYAPLYMGRAWDILDPPVSDATTV